MFRRSKTSAAEKRAKRLFNAREEIASLQKEVSAKSSKRSRLRDLDCFVLDNSLRESTVGQLRGHTLENKMRIYEEVKRCGFHVTGGIIVASFAHMTRVDDHFLQELNRRNEDMSALYSFSDLVSYPVVDGMPDTQTIPIGLVKLKQYKLRNPIFEVDLADSSVDYSKFTMEKLCEVLAKRIDYALENLAADAKIFVNLRDFPLVMAKAPERVFELVTWLATRPRELRAQLGIIYEEATGKFYPEDMGVWTKKVRKLMTAYDWKDGHLLVHVHKKYGHGETTQLKCLSNGANGIWASVAEEGAGIGHACSCITLMNLVRMGNVKVQQRYNCAYLRTAAQTITEITTGTRPHPKQIIYGERALDLAFDFGGIAGGVVGKNDFDLAKFFGEEAPLRISTLASVSMIVKSLTKYFCNSEEQFTEPVAEEMKKKMIDDLKGGRKEEYTSKLGIAVLFDRAGGKLTAEMCEEIEKDKLATPHQRELMAAVREIWDTWDLMENNSKDECLGYDSFYNGFMAPYFACYRCDDTKRGLKAIDMDADGKIDWSEFSLYIKWGLRQYPNVKDTEELLSIVFRKGIIPAMQDEAIKQKL